ncbi:TetR family transcriptional regulator [Pseudorhodoferax sp. LjRoot39]|uniref:TetR family transcriptional regulator n=1 Tax=Pseudorhodoferax sp. LjRoot39 TaxID=3342328 RepID=UPI003ECCF7AA
MTSDRKPADKREKELRLAIVRIQRGRATRTQSTKLTISSVAEEVGVSPALIYNHYPQIAEAIRTAQGRDSRTQRDAKQSALLAERAKARALREEVAGLKLDVRRLASINETLAAENASLRAQVASPNVQQLDTRRAGKEPR